MTSSKKNILIVGSAARDHALAWKLAQSPRVGKIFVAPGNGGIEPVAKPVEIAVDDYDRLIEFAKESSVDIVYVSGDDQLGDGFVDMCTSAGVSAFGPSRAATQIEASKAFSKDFMIANGIPTADFKTFEDHSEAQNYLLTQTMPIVVKASGLAGGKGAVICHSLEEAQNTVKTIMQDKQFGDAGKQIVIEEFLIGPEISIHAFSDGTSYSLFPPAQDHKAACDGNTGLNTGGMGVVAPLNEVSSDLMKQIEKQIVAPALRGLKSQGSPFVGVLYPGIMQTENGPKVLEYNARPGDPETQCYMRLLKTDLLDIIEACLMGKLHELSVEWSDQAVANIVLASGGYPETYEKGKEITGTAEAESEPGVVVFHAGTTSKDGKLVTNGGRVLSVTATGENLDEALALAYRAADKIQFEGKMMRTDIGRAHDNKILART